MKKVLFKMRKLFIGLAVVCLMVGLVGCDELPTDSSSNDRDATSDVGDKLTYEQYKDSTSELERSWANSAKMRANKTANVYNEYILKNSYVFEDNIPSDIVSELPILE